MLRSVPNPIVLKHEDHTWFAIAATDSERIKNNLLSLSHEIERYLAAVTLFAEIDGPVEMSPLAAENLASAASKLADAIKAQS